MNDTTLADAVKSGLTEACDSLSTVHLAIPASEIMARAGQARRRRRLGVLAGAGGLAAVAVAMSVALPAGHPATGPGAQLAAWTVTRQADGSIKVTFRELLNAAGLQRKLRADGVPASVTFIGAQNPACRSFPVRVPAPSRRSTPPARRGPGGRPPAPPSLSSVVSGPHQVLLGDAMVIRPSALPPGAGLQIAVSGWDQTLEVGLVKASPQCTGS